MALLNLHYFPNKIFMEKVARKWRHGPVNFDNTWKVASKYGPEFCQNIKNAYVCNIDDAEETLQAAMEACGNYHLSCFFID